MRPKKRVLLSIAEPNIAKIIDLILQKGLSDTYDLSIQENPYVAQLLAQPQREPADLFILLLNNLMCSGVPLLREKNKAEAGPAIIAHLRDTYQKPVIAMMGWLPEDGAWSEENLKRAGARDSFLIPPDRELFLKAVRHCLEDGMPVENGRLP